MLFTFDKNTKEINLYQPTEFRTHHILERQDIETWVENYPDILGEELLVLTTEYDQFDRTNERIDLLAIDKLGNLVVIELKRDDSGKAVELQALKYAAYCSTLTLDQATELLQRSQAKKRNDLDIEAARRLILEFIRDDEFEELGDKPRIILVAREFRPEVTASVLWLRKFGIDISCVKLTPYQLDAGRLVFESATLIPLPEAEDFIIKSERKDNVQDNLSVTRKEYISFYRELSGRLEAFLPSLPFPAPIPKSYYGIPTGIGGVHFEWAFHGRPRSSFGVELHFERGREFNKKAIRQLENMRETIATVTGEEPIFQEDWGKTWSKIYIEKSEGKMTEELKNWAVEKMKLFYELLAPEVLKLRA
jgi:hypothetical protein